MCLLGVYLLLGRRVSSFCFVVLEVLEGGLTVLGATVTDMLIAMLGICSQEELDEEEAALEEEIVPVPSIEDVSGG